MKKIYLLLNNKVAGPYDINLLTKMELDKDLKIRYEDDTEWTLIEDFLKQQNDYTLLGNEDTEFIEFKNNIKFVRLKEKKVKHTRHSLFWFIHKFTARYNINTIYITILLISFAVIIAYLYFRYHLFLVNILF